MDDAKVGELMSRCSTRAGATAKPPECQRMEVQFKDSLSWERAFTEKILRGHKTLGWRAPLHREIGMGGDLGRP